MNRRQAFFTTVFKIAFSVLICTKMGKIKASNCERDMG